MKNLAPLDCHAHVSSDVTDTQIQQLNGAVVFAMTRSPAEALGAIRRRQSPTILWGLGVHPSYIARGGGFDANSFLEALPEFALIGEVGLDRRSGALADQRRVFRQILEVTWEHNVLVSIHSAGCVKEVLDLLSDYNRPGLILHWFSGDTDQLNRALDLGCLFSVNSLMRESVLNQLPIDRILPETDFPTRNRRSGSRPGDTSAIEEIVARHAKLRPEQVRAQWYRNLRKSALESGAIDRMPQELAERLVLQSP